MIKYHLHYMTLYLLKILYAIIFSFLHSSFTIPFLYLFSLSFIFLNLQSILLILPFLVFNQPPYFLTFLVKVILSIFYTLLIFYQLPNKPPLVLLHLHRKDLFAFIKECFLLISYQDHSIP